MKIRCIKLKIFLALSIYRSKRQVERLKPCSQCSGLKMPLLWENLLLVIQYRFMTSTFGDTKLMTIIPLPWQCEWTLKIMNLYENYLNKMCKESRFYRTFCSFSFGDEIRSVEKAISRIFFKIKYKKDRFYYRSGTVNSNTVNSKFHLIRSYFEIFFYHFPNISCFKCTVNSNFHLIRSKTLLTNDFELTVPDLQ